MKRRYLIPLLAAAWLAGFYLLDINLKDGSS